jgi:hypothetical protein
MKIVPILKEETSGEEIFLDKLNVKLLPEHVSLLMSVPHLNQAVSLPMVLITPTVRPEELEPTVWLMVLVSLVPRTPTVPTMEVPLLTNQFVIFLLELVYPVMSTMIVKMQVLLVETTVELLVVATTVHHLPHGAFPHPLQR